MSTNTKTTLESIDAQLTDFEDECDCDALGGFPCWPCVHSGEKTLE